MRVQEVPIQGPDTAGPVSPRERIQVVDMLRGFALSGGYHHIGLNTWTSAAGGDPPQRPTGNRRQDSD